MNGDMRTFFLLLLLELLGINGFLGLLGIGAGIVVAGSCGSLAFLGRSLSLAGRCLLVLGGCLWGGQLQLCVTLGRFGGLEFCK